jgi:hypothetical protein
MAKGRALGRDHLRHIPLIYNLAGIHNNSISYLLRHLVEDDTHNIR